jgi:hypothetical protein
MENKEITQEFKDAYSAVAKDKSQRDAFSELIVKWIQPNHLSSNLVSLFLNTRSIKSGDAMVYKVRRGMEVRKLVPGTIPLQSEVAVNDRINYAVEFAQVGLTYNLWELESGEIGTLGELQNEMRAKLSDYYVNRVFTALSTIWSTVNTPTNYTNVGGTVTATALKNAIDNINLKVGRVRAVVGTRKALTPITTFGAGWDTTTAAGTTQQANYPALNEIWQTGWLGRYYGAPIVALDQIYDNPIDYRAMLPEDKILVIGENVGEFLMYGDVKSQNYDRMDVIPPQYMLNIFQSFGLVVTNAQGIHILKVS